MTDRNREMSARVEGNEAQAFIAWLTENDDMLGQNLIRVLNRIGVLSNANDSRVPLSQAVRFSMYLSATVGAELADAFANFKRGYNARN